MGKVLVFGSFVVDLMARSAHLPVPGETIRGTMFKMGAGGKGFNQGIAAHKAGAEVVMVTKLGKDELASIAVNAAKEVGMESNFFYSESAGTGTALILVDQDSGQNEIVVVPGACDTFMDEEIAAVEDIINKSEYVLLQLEVNQNANEKIAELSHKWGCKVIVNTAPYSKISDEFLEGVYLVTPNEVEAEELSGIKVDDLESAKKAADYFKAKGVENVIITLGSRGAFVSADGEEKIVPAFKVKAIDATGAGDAFNGGLLCALSEGKSFFEAVRFANALAALSVQKLGTTPSMPMRAEIDAFLESH